MEVETGKKKKVRGLTTLPHLTKNSNPLRRVVKYNEKGQPVGPMSTQLFSYMGVLARTMVPLSYEHWRKVPNALKEKLWSFLEVKFVIESKSKKKLMGSVGMKWRTFKSYLTRTYIIPFKDQPQLLKHPPPKYSFIDQEDWDLFVQSRLTEQFQNFSNSQIERRSKHKLVHRLSRKGYVGLADEMKKNGHISSIEEVDRSLLWKMARQNNKGEYVNEAVKEKAEKIDELKKQVEEGSLVGEGNFDILTMALGTEEHPGRVRGLGHFVTESTDLNVSKPINSKEQLRIMKSQLQEEKDRREKAEEELNEERRKREELEVELRSTQSKLERTIEKLETMDSTVQWLRSQFESFIQPSQDKSNGSN